MEMEGLVQVLLVSMLKKKSTKLFYIYLEIDECSVGSNNCEHNCRNTAGSFVCSCFTGYSLTANGFSCMSMYDCTSVLQLCCKIATSCDSCSSFK